MVQLQCWSHYTADSTLLPAGRESLDSGRFYVDATGSVAKQTIKLCPGLVGAFACDDIALLETQPLEALKVKDGFGRTAAMFAALFNSWAVLQHLLKVPDGVDWCQSQSAPVSMPLLLSSSCPLQILSLLYTNPQSNNVSPMLDMHCMCRWATLARLQCTTCVVILPQQQRLISTPRLSTCFLICSLQVYWTLEMLKASRR